MTSAAATLSASPAKIGRVLSPGGVEAWHVQSDLVPLVALAFTFEGGSAKDPPGKAGVAQMLARLLDEGAGAYSSDAFQERLAARAIELSFNAGPDAVGGSLKTLVRHADEAFALLRLALASPRFDEDAIERVRAQTIAGLRYQQNDPGVMASRRFFAEAFPGHPYGHPTSGTIESVAAITRQDIRDLHARVIADGREKIAAVGAIDPERLAGTLDGVFGALPHADAAAPLPAAEVAGRGTRHVVDIDVPQSVIRFGTDGLSWRDPDFIAAYVLNHILGGGAFTSRLFQEVREKRGLAYNVYSFQSMYAGTGQVGLYLGTRPDNVVRAMRVVADELDRMREDPASADELGRSKENVKGRIVLSLESTTARMNRLGASVLADMPLMSVDEVIERIDAVTLDDIAALARDLFAPERLSAAGIGADPAAFRRAVEPVSPALVGEAVA
ncbi:MAG: M16 family metallopeptidase [Microvirga sp.]